MEIDASNYPLGLDQSAASFYYELIPGWRNSHGSAHTCQENSSGPYPWNCGFTNPNDTEVSGIATSRISSWSYWSEGVFQNKTFSKDPFVTYHLFARYQVKDIQSGWTPNHFINFRLARDLINGEIHDGTPPNVPNRLLHTQHMTDLNVIETCIDFQLAQNETFDQVWIDINPPAENIPNQWTGFDYVSLICSTEALTAIQANKNGREVQFSAINSSTMSDFVTYDWDFGDGNTSTEANPLHTYYQAGDYTVCLKITDSNGCCGELCYQIIIESVSPCDDLVGTDCIVIGSPFSTVLLSDLLAGPDPQIPSQPAGFLFPSARLVNGPCFYLYGKLVVDTDVVFSNTHWYMDPGAEIEQSTWLLWAGNSVFQGCDYMWRGINNHESGTYKVTVLLGNTIRDAYRGVALGNNNGIYAAENVFIDNYTGMYMGAESEVATIKNSFVQNTFEGTGNMLQEYPGQPKWDERARIGIHVENLSQLDVNTSEDEKNTFLNIRIGIYSQMSNIYVSAAEFINNQDFIATGIHLSPAGAITKISENKFDEMTTGIYIVGGIRSAIWIEENYFYFSRFYPNSNGHGINIRQTPTSGVWIRDNVFDFFQQGKCVKIINGLAYLKLDENTFNIIGKGSFVDPVLIYDLKSPSFINENTFNINTTQPYTKSLFDIKNSSFLRVLDNVINDIAQTASISSTGYIIQGTDKSLFRNNHLNIKSKGFMVLGSQSVKGNGFCCNITSSDMNESFHFGWEHGKTDLRQNTLRNLQLPGNIGPQISAGNNWIGTGTAANLVEEGISKASDNRFVINQSVSGAIPETILPASIAYDWFLPGGSHPTCIEEPDCGIGFYNIPDGSGGNGDMPDCELIRTFYLRLIRINSGIEPDEHSLAKYALEALLYEWTMDFGIENILDCLEGQIISIGPEVIAWEEVGRQIDNVYEIDTNLENTLTDILTHIQEISELVMQLTQSDIANPDQNIVAMYDELADLNTSYNSLVSSYQATVKARAQVLIPLINVLPENHSFLTDRKKAWLVKMKLIAGQQDYITTREWEEIREIAYKCPDIAGQAVFEAQTLMAMQGEYIDTDIECRTIDPRADKSVKENSLRLYPNPGTGLFYLELPDDHDISTINISSVHRNNILSIPANSQTTIMLDLNGYKSGIYYYECISDNRPVFRGKFILINP